MCYFASHFSCCTQLLRRAKQSLEFIKIRIKARVPLAYHMSIACVAVEPRLQSWRRFASHARTVYPPTRPPGPDRPRCPPRAQVQLELESVMDTLQKDSNTGKYTTRRNVPKSPKSPTAPTPASPT